MNKKEFIL